MSRERSHRAQAGPASSRSRRRTGPEGDGGVGAASRRVVCLTFGLGSLAILQPENRTSGGKGGRSGMSFPCDANPCEEACYKIADIAYTYND